ncbi:hypothetical protein TRVL_02996 [Trypanosoma vivax]|nr:hypothetical protein TRVL_02996 [Trypanosoma vivax]
MHKSSDSSVFEVLFSYSNTRAKRHSWRHGCLYVSFSKATLFNNDTKKIVDVARAMGVQPCRPFSLMVEAGNGTGWVPGTELTIGYYAVRVEETVHLHLKSLSPSGDSTKVCEHVGAPSTRGVRRHWAKKEGVDCANMASFVSCTTQIKSSEKILLELQNFSR